MKRIILLGSLLISVSIHADSINKYMEIEKSIPKMELKPDAKAQAWARSARNILVMNDESIAQTAMVMNQLAAQQGQAIYCLPKGQQLDSKFMHKLILKAANNLSAQENTQNLTVSSVAITALIKQYPCKAQSRHAALPFDYTSKMQSVHSNS